MTTCIFYITVTYVTVSVMLISRRTQKAFNFKEKKEVSGYDDEGVQDSP